MEPHQERIKEATMSYLASLLLLMLAFGPVPQQQEPPKAVPETVVKPDKVAVYVYRYKQYQGGALEPSVFCDEVQLARMDNGRFFKVLLEPGKHVFRSEDKQSGVELDLKPGQDYYLRVEISVGFWKGHGRLLLVPAEQGAFEIKKLKPLSAEKVKDRERVVVDGSATAAKTEEPKKQ